MLTFRSIWKTKDVRNSIIYVVLILALFRFAAHIPVPGVDAEALVRFFQSNQVLGLLNLFSGGTLENFSIVALGVAPYITSSIIFQLLTMIVPSLEEMNKEEAGRQKMNQWTRIATVPLAALQGYALILLFKTQGLGSAALGGLAVSGFDIASAIIVMSAGSVFLMWLGELMSEKHVGNGISILIFSSIIAGLPTFLQRTFATYTSDQLFSVIMFVALVMLTVVAVVVIHEGTRNIPVQYARQRALGRMSGRIASNLPLRVNMAGVIPIIFAISLIIFPQTAAQFFVNAKTDFIREAALFISTLFQNQLFYGAIYFVLVFLFTYFYTEVVFHPQQVAENLQRQGGFIPGIRPGKHTAEYLQWTTNRILLTGAFFLGIIAVLPIIVQAITRSQLLVIGGTSVLIVVSVVIESIKQVESNVSMHEYDSIGL
ncbi:MAG: hypothetical protein ACD_76C00094G0027 [uncultured bacterium]|nr:MAG: hypothetical protein ACD_76C00094G0027 [uncultured bacterium]HBD05282.1 preprotein translocase subunit SecY [Candidatus Uhrbacteria bacterium]